MGTKIQTIDLKWGIDETLIPNSSAYMKNAAGVVGFEDISTELTALGYTTGGGSKFWGTGSDWAIDGTTNVTITGSNNTYIVKNYTSWAAGGAARVLTITPTNCILHIRVQWNMDLTNWTFDFAGKWAAGGASSNVTYGNVGSNGISLSTSVNTAWAGWHAQDPFDRWWGGWAGAGANWAWTSDGSWWTTAGGIKSSDIVLDYIKWARRIYIATGAGGWSWWADWSWTWWAGGAWGGAVIVEVLWNLTLDNWTTVINMNWNVGSNGIDPGWSQNRGSGGGGWGGGSFYAMYNWTLTGTVTPTVAGWAGWTGGSSWWVGWVWLYLIEANTVFA